MEHKRDRLEAQGPPHEFLEVTASWLSARREGEKRRAGGTMGATCLGSGGHCPRHDPAHAVSACFGALGGRQAQRISLAWSPFLIFGPQVHGRGQQLCLPVPHAPGVVVIVLATLGKYHASSFAPGARATGASWRAEPVRPNYAAATRRWADAAQPRLLSAEGEKVKEHKDP